MANERVSKMLRNCLSTNTFLYAINLDRSFSLFSTFSQAKFRADYHKDEAGVSKLRVLFNSIRIY